jgi:hypothetical protein
MDALDALISARVTKPVGIATGQIPVWNGSTFVAKNTSQITTSPSDGNIWAATAVDANGTRWAFQFNAGSGSAFKWEFIGGFPQAVSPVGSITTASAVPVDLTGGPTLTLARAGDYMIEFGDYVTLNVAGINNMTTLLNVSGVNQSQTNGLNFVATAQFQGGQQSTETIVTVAAATVLKLQVESQNSLSSNFQGGWMKATPRRVN